MIWNPAETLCGVMYIFAERSRGFVIGRNIFMAFIARGWLNQIKTICGWIGLWNLNQSFGVLYLSLPSMTTKSTRYRFTGLVRIRSSLPTGLLPKTLAHGYSCVGGEI